MGFNPTTSVVMVNKTLKSVENLEYGDTVSCGNNQFARVHKIQSVNFDQPFQMCNYFGVMLTARSVVRNEEHEWKYCCDLSTDHASCPIIMQIELDSIHEIECKGNNNKTIVCMTKNHTYDRLVYDAVHSENIEDSDFCSWCGGNCVNYEKVFQSYCGEIDYCSKCVPIIHFAVSRV